MTNRALITLGRSIEGFADSGAAKLATLWFDELRFELGPILNSGLLVIPGGAPDFEEWKRRVLTQEEPDIDEDVFQAIRGQWKSADSVAVASSPEHLPTSVHAAVGAAVSGLEDSLNQEGAHPLEIAKETGAARARLERQMAAWLPVSNEIALLGDELQERTLKILSILARRDSSHETFCDVVSDRVPDFSALSWTQIVELRNHGNFRAFRSKILELDEMILEGQTQPAGKLLEHLFQQALVDLAKLTRPNVPWAMAKGLIGNLPLGLIPLNPSSVYYSLKDVAKERKIRDEFGWAYFLIDLNDMRKRR